mmetsp:Transcript_31922/g.54993  ORF Transcript_31922/g.54993 Transcript_31922/m.54993 type:complete len:180 (+) Transcript_31922:3629-4168(+)
MDPEWSREYALRKTLHNYNQNRELALVTLRSMRIPSSELKIDFWGDFIETTAFNVFIAAFGGYVIGLAFGFVFSAMEQNEVDTKLGLRAQISQVYKGTWTRMTSQARGFATFGSLYVAFESPMEKFRGVKDTWNAMFAGFSTGAIFAKIGGAGWRGTVGGGLSCGAFCYLIEHFMHNRE